MIVSALAKDKFSLTMVVSACAGCCVCSHHVLVCGFQWRDRKQSNYLCIPGKLQQSSIDSAECENIEFVRDGFLVMKKMYFIAELQGKKLLKKGTCLPQSD